MEEKIRELEGAKDCLVSSSGMNAATTMLLALVPAGGHHHHNRLLQAHQAVHPDCAAQDGGDSNCAGPC